MSDREQKKEIPPLFQDDLRVISAGVAEFAEALRRQSVEVIELDWLPPADGNPELVGLLTRLYSDPDLNARIDAANQEVLRRIVESNPQVVDVAPAREAMGLRRSDAAAATGHRGCLRRGHRPTMNDHEHTNLREAFPIPQYTAFAHEVK